MILLSDKVLKYRLAGWYNLKNQMERLCALSMETELPADANPIVYLVCHHHVSLWSL